MDRIAEISDNLIGVESPDDLMIEILEALSETEGQYLKQGTIILLYINLKH